MRVASARATVRPYVARAVGIRLTFERADVVTASGHPHYRLAGTPGVRRQCRGGRSGRTTQGRRSAVLKGCAFRASPNEAPAAAKSVGVTMLTRWSLLRWQQIAPILYQADGHGRSEVTGSRDDRVELHGDPVRGQCPTGLGASRRVVEEQAHGAGRASWRAGRCGQLFLHPRP
jgi:hypothetical protein